MIYFIVYYIFRATAQNACSPRAAGLMILFQGILTDLRWCVHVHVHCVLLQLLGWPTCFFTVQNELYGLRSAPITYVLAISQLRSLTDDEKAAKVAKELEAQRKVTGKCFVVMPIFIC